MQSSVSALVKNKDVYLFMFFQVQMPTERDVHTCSWPTPRATWRSGSAFCAGSLERPQVEVQQSGFAFTLALSEAQGLK